MVMAARKGMGIIEYRNPEPDQIRRAEVRYTSSRKETKAGKDRWKVVAGSTTLYRSSTELKCDVWLDAQRNLERLKVKFLTSPATGGLTYVRGSANRKTG